jgi:hypothetical protein
MRRTFSTISTISGRSPTGAEKGVLGAEPFIVEDSTLARTKNLRLEAEQI